MTHADKADPPFFRRKVQPLLERLAAAVVLLCFAPVLALAAAAVLAETGRPILFRQTRVGRGGKPFSLLKLRSMRAGAPGSLITAGGDCRVSRVPAYKFCRSRATICGRVG